MDWLSSFLVSLGGLAGLASLITVLVTAKSTRGKNRAESASIITKSATELLIPMQDRISKQDSRLEAQEKRIDDLENELYEMRTEVRKKDHIIQDLVRYIRTLIGILTIEAPHVKIPTAQNDLAKIIHSE